MTQEVHWTVSLSIKEGQLEAFKSVMADMIGSAEREAGTLAYEWCFNADETECIVYERYTDSDAVIAHFGNFPAFADRFRQTCDRGTMTVLGRPNSAAREFLDGATPNYLQTQAGFAKFAA